MRFHYSVTHVAGKDLNTADTLSCLPDQEADDTASELQKEVEAYVLKTVEGLAVCGQFLS